MLPVNLITHQAASFTGFNPLFVSLLKASAQFSGFSDL